MNELENELEEAEIAEFEDETEKKLEENREKLEENPDDILKSIIFKGIDEIYITQTLIEKTLELYNFFNFKEKAKGIDIIRSIFAETLHFSKFNFSQRIIDFFDFILSIPTLKFEYIKNALNFKDADLKKQNNINNKDIIYFWKQYIAEQQLKEENISIISEQMKDSLRLLLEHNFNLNEINYIFNLFKKVINDNKTTQFDIIHSLISILILYPNFLNEKNPEKRRKNEKDLKEFMDKYIIQLNDKYIFDEKKNTALDFYLKISGDKNYNESSELNVQEIFQHLKMNNPNISEFIINDISKKLEMINSVINNIIFCKYEAKNFQQWTKIELPELKRTNPEMVTPTILGMISLAIKKTKGYFLRNTQLIAILLFITKDQKKGLIEEISTGEGKSCIISSLSIYYALNGHKVDIISSSYTLAQRDSEEFKDLYNFFNLTTGYPSNSQPGPYTKDILYGTFLEFEGDYLREITSKKKIRNNRPYDVIIIDEVDNLFIDNILGSTRLTHSSLGFKFLIPIYLTIYLYFEIFDYFFLLFFRICLENVKNDEKKKKYERLIQNPKERKKEMTKIIEGNFDEIFQSQNLHINTSKNSKIDKLKEEEIIKKIDKAENEFDKLLENLSKYLEIPEFLNTFVENQFIYWLDSAYNAKNFYEIDRDYVEINNSGNRDIAPVDRTNTGEIELRSVYDDGLHQMLEIKHKLRVNDETLVDTFLSHITFFQKYKKNNCFLFFGLTGTIGDKETQKIYGNQYYDSNLLFIPQYKKKRFVELPPLLVNIRDHYFIICKDIIINFYKGRKILVICNSIKEAKIIEDELKNSFDIEQLQIDKNLISKQDYKESIILYTRSDIEKGNIKEKKKRIILSTNLGGRGTDIQTTNEEEEAGGLHVIITYMPINYRVLKQAFGRTSREGKKGTGQLILRNEGYSSYSKIRDEMYANEKKRISKIQKQLRIVLFKDNLFEKYIQIVKNVNFNGFLIDDINQRWSNFLRDNVNSYKDDLKTDEINKKFETFKENITNILNEKERYKQFQNPFYKMKEGLRKYDYYEKELMNYFNFETKINKFFFVQPYIRAIITIKNTKKYNDIIFQEVKNNFNETIKRINLLIEENINPVLKSFEQWENIVFNFESILKDVKNYHFITDNDNPISSKSFIDSDFCVQYENIKKVCNKIISRIEVNKMDFENFRKEYKRDNKFYLIVIEEELEYGLKLSENEKKEYSFFDDSAFKSVFKLSIKRKMGYLGSFIWIIIILGIISLIVTFFGWAAAGIIGLVYASYRAVSAIYYYKKGREISTDSLLGNVFFVALKSMNKNKKNSFEIVQNVNNGQNMIKSYKNILFEQIIFNIEIKFEKIKTSNNLLNFLIFIDYYYSSEIWAQKIKTIFEENFDKIYKDNFIKNSFLKTEITNKTISKHLEIYNNIFDQYLDECNLQINKLGDPKKYNKKEGLNCLEHLIIDLNSEKITEDMANKIVQKMIEYNLVSQGGIINKKLFEECFVDNNGNKLTQKTKFHINSKIGNNQIIKYIKNLKDFKIEGFEIPLVNASFLDLANFYQINYYNVKDKLEKNFSSFIIINFKQIIIFLLNMDPMVLQNFYTISLNYIKEMVKNLLQEKIFTKYNKSSFENVISSELTNEERLEFSRLIEEASKNVGDLMKKK